eukprot:s192_g23.t1
MLGGWNYDPCCYIMLYPISTTVMLLPSTVLVFSWPTLQQFVLVSNEFCTGCAVSYMGTLLVCHFGIDLMVNPDQTKFGTPHCQLWSHVSVSSPFV